MIMTRADRASTREETGRNTRVPLGVARSKLTVAGRPGYRRRWINDSEGRLQNAQDGGYEFVMNENVAQIGDADIGNENRDLGARTSRVVDSGTGQRAYLMEIKEEFYQEDQRAKVAKVEETDRRIRKGKLEEVDGGYVPDDGKGIQIETRRR
jgi:hypothetical protein